MTKTVLAALVATFAAMPCFAQDREADIRRLSEQKLAYSLCVRERAVELGRSSTEQARDIAGVVARQCGWSEYLDAVATLYTTYTPVKDRNSPVIQEYVARQLPFRDALVEEVAIAIVEARMTATQSGQ